MTRENLEQQLGKIKQEFLAHPNGKSTLRETTLLMDQVLDSAYLKARKAMPSNTNENALLATGGFARRELHPYSDIDIIVLFENPLQAEDEEFLKRLLHPLWDLGLNVGHHVLPLKAYRFDQRNLELATALLDIRLLSGSSRAFSQFKQKELQYLLNRQKKEFLKTLLAAQDERHKRFNETVYQLEPDIKDAPGGLRDLHVARWIGRILYGIETNSDFIKHDLLSATQLHEVQEAQQFLLSLRTHLHVLSGRNKNVLSHEFQEEIARKLGYKGVTESETVEALMKDYFLRAKVIHGFSESMTRRAFPPSQKSNRTFHFSWSTTVVRRGALDFVSESTISENPANALKLFYRSAKYQIPISENALVQVKKHLDLIDEKVRASAEIRDLFLKLLRQQRGIYRVLFLMHEIGLLGRIFPEFDRIRCHVIQDFFHKYTVDEHSLLTIKNLEDLYHARKPRERRFGDLLKGLARPELLLFSMLFHDVGKADPGNHCEQSIIAVNRIARRIGLPEEDADKIRFLISSHLEMSNVFQRRDITDDLVVKRFADFIGTQENLRMLCLVTYADIKAVSPEALTTWKEDVLWQLYVETDAQLTREFADDRWGTSQDQGFLEEVSKHVSDYEARGRLRNFLDGFPRRYLKFTPKTKIAEHFKLAEKLHSAEDFILKLSRRRSRYELSLMAFDRPFLFAKLTGVLSYFGMNILRGQAFANRQGIILDVIEFEDRFQTFKLNRSEIERFRETLQNVLLNRQDLTELLRKRESSILYQPKTRGSIATFIAFDDHSSEKYSIMEIVTQDRFGLLYTIARAISENGCNIDVALISTEGHKAIDVFYLTQDSKKLSIQAQQELTASMKEGLDRVAA